MNWSEEDKVWGRAIDDWLNRNPISLSELIESRTELPEMARSFLSDLVLGKVSKGKGGQPRARTPQQERIITAEVHKMRESGLTKDSAITEVAALRKATEDEIRGIYERTKISFKDWQLWGHPNFK